MRFHCLLPVRDEADILPQCLDHLLVWADAVYIYDTGSTDESWEIVQEYARRDSRIIPLCKTPSYFSETRLRGWMFQQARKNMETGDWFLRVDADEFHHVKPPDFVNERLRGHETIVYHQYYNFMLLESEVIKWEAGIETIADRRRPISERRNWYIPSVYAEPRLCRYRASMKWPSTVSFPFNAGYVALERLPIRHYPHRDPLQLERRCRLRAIMMADKENRANWSSPDLHHWAEREWRKMVSPDGLLELRHWQPSTVLQEVHQTNHLAKPIKRMLQRAVHSLALPLLDRCRSGWLSSDSPQFIPSDVQSELEMEMKL